MKKTFLLTLFSFFLSVFMTACTGQMAVVDNLTASSDPCDVIDKKMMRLDEFTEVVKNTSAFHLEEKASTLPSPGFTVSNNRKQMLRDAEKKRTELLAERQKNGCTTTMDSSTVQVAEKASFSSDPCDSIDKKMMRLDEFTEVVKNTSAFHLEEKASALPSPGFTVSNNRKQMLRDAEKKRTELLAERKKNGCKAPVNVVTARVADKSAVVDKISVSSGSRVARDKERIKVAEPTTTVNNSRVLAVEEKRAAQPVSKITVNNNKEQMLNVAEKKDAELSAEHQKQDVETSKSTETRQITDKIAVKNKTSVSSEACAAIDKELIKLYEFTIMVNNTSSFHLEEKISALPSPGFTVSSNKKKMLRDAEKKRAELLAERQKQGCEIPEKE